MIDARDPRLLADGAAQLSRKVIGSPPAPAGSITRNREPSAVTSYWGTLDDGLSRVLNSGRGMPDIGGPLAATSAAIIVAVAAR